MMRSVPWPARCAFLIAAILYYQCAIARSELAGPSHFGRRRSFMLQGYRVFDADAHGSINPEMWDDLPVPYLARRPRPVTIHDASGLGNYTAGWLIEGSVEPHALGPGAQQANTPRNVIAEFGAETKRE